MMLRFLLLFGLVVSAGCATGNCRAPAQEEAKTKMSQKSGEVLPATRPPTDTTAPDARISVFKYNGARQCGVGKATAIDEMAKELTGIKILSSSVKNDGLMHIQVCGGPTGQANVYEIYQVDLDKAKKRGFQVWNF